MTEQTREQFAHFIAAAQSADGGAEYPLSIAHGLQTGRIFTEGDAVLFWHFCGFAQISGKPDRALLTECEELMLHGKERFVLITSDPEVTAFFAQNPAFQSAPRIAYACTQPCLPAPELPDGFKLRRIDSTWLPRLQGRIVPAFSWDSSERFLQNGFGFCITQGETAAACAFTAAVTPDSADIGLETAPEFRRLGLAKCAAAAVLNEICEAGKRAVWAHHAENAGSARTAAAVGFRKTAVFTAIHKT